MRNHRTFHLCDGPNSEEERLIVESFCNIVGIETTRIDYEAFESQQFNSSICELVLNYKSSFPRLFNKLSESKLLEIVNILFCAEAFCLGRYFNYLLDE